MIAELHYRSQCLDRDAALNLLLPDALSAADGPVVVTLLHGMHGAYDSWLRRTRLEAMLRGKNVAVVMPEGGNSYYHDMKYGEKYFTLVTEEVPALVRRLFGFSDAREKNYIAGLSMGGYGAFRAALLLPERYAGAASLSGALAPEPGVRAPKAEYAVKIWGEDYKKIFPGSDSDLLHLVETFPADRPAPKLYFTCGTEDSLYSMHQKMKKALEDRGGLFDFTCEEGPGIHNWLFWDAWILPALKAILPEGTLS